MNFFLLKYSTSCVCRNNFSKNMSHVNFEITFYYKKCRQKILGLWRILYPLYDCAALICCGVLIGRVQRVKLKTLGANTALPAKRHCSIIVLKEKERHVPEASTVILNHLISGIWLHVQWNMFFKHYVNIRFVFFHGGEYRVEGENRYLRNVGKFLPYYSTSYIRIQ